MLTSRMGSSTVQVPYSTENSLVSIPISGVSGSADISRLLSAAVALPDASSPLVLERMDNTPVDASTEAKARARFRW